jgi:hypothetical protein
MFNQYIGGGMATQYSSMDVAKGLKISYQRLRGWIDRQYVPMTEAPDGPGTRTRFSRKDIYMIELFRRLVAKGFSRELAAKYAKSFGMLFKKSWDEWGNPAFLVCRSGGSDEFPELNAIYSHESDLPFHKAMGNRLDNMPAWDDFDDAVIINFTKIRKKVDMFFS